MIWRNDMIGKTLTVDANQAARDAVIIAAVDSQALIEYAMPKGRTFLRILQLDDAGNVVSDYGRAVGYKRIPAKFLAQMRHYRGRVMGLIRCGFDGTIAPARKFWQRDHNRREAEKAAALRVRILGGQ